MPRYSQPQKSKPKKSPIKEDEKAPKRRSSMPDLQSMGNEALLDNLANNRSMILPLAPGNEDANQSLSDSFLVIESDDEGYEGDSEYDVPDNSLINTNKKKKPEIELKLPHQQPKKIDDPQEAQEAVRDSEDENSDLDQSSSDMKPAAGYNFQPLPLEPQKKISGWSKFLNAATSILGTVIGKTLGAIINLGLIPVTAPIIAGAYSRSDNLKDVMQKKRRHDYIPGWDGAKFNPEKNSGKDIMADFRRVPTVWSYLTADRAEESRGQPKDPVVSVYIDQPVSGSSQAMNGSNMGHTMLGIEYSRYSNISNRYERYGLQYGFYPAGGFSKVSPTLMMANKNAVVPGQLLNDKGHSYSVSRSFKASPKQVNAIFKASETYADKGYGYYDRNCSTFVKEMLVDVAHIPAGNDIFQEEEVDFSGVANAGRFAAMTFGINARAGMENQMMDLAMHRDQSYQGYGNMRTTKEDYATYKKSIENDTYTKSTYIPGSSGERLRRLSGKNSGEIGSRQYKRSIKDMMGLQILNDNIENEGFDLKDVIREVLNDRLQAGEQVPQELTELIQAIPVFGFPLMELENKAQAYARTKGKERVQTADWEALSPDDIQRARQETSVNITKLNILLNKYFKNDKRLHEPIMNMISLLNYALIHLDSVYEQSNRGANSGGDLGSIRGEMTKKVIRIDAGGKVCPFTPTHYESYLQIYKTPEKAVASYSRYLELKQKQQTGEELSSAEQKEFEKLDRIETVAGDYDNAHNYMLEKEGFSMQDIQYAFKLQNKEQENARSSAFYSGQTSSGIYQSLIFEQVFGGMKERFNTNADFQDMQGINSENIGKMKEWLDKDLNQCAAKKFKELIMIIDGMQLAMKDPAEDEIAEQFYQTMMIVWIERVFPNKSIDKNLQTAYLTIPSAFNAIMNDKNSAFRKTIDKIIKLIKMNQ